MTIIFPRKTRMLTLRFSRDWANVEKYEAEDPFFFAWLACIARERKSENSKVLKKVSRGSGEWNPRSNFFKSVFCPTVIVRVPRRTGYSWWFSVHDSRYFCRTFWHSSRYFDTATECGMNETCEYSWCWWKFSQTSVWKTRDRWAKYVMRKSCYFPERFWLVPSLNPLPNYLHDVLHENNLSSSALS